MKVDLEICIVCIKNCHMPLSNCILLHKSTKLYSSVLKTASSKSNPTIPTDENEYECNKRYKGLAIIISNENFKTLTCRKYCDDEIRLMQETFGKCLKFTVITFKDLKAKQINLVLKIGKFEYLKFEVIERVQ